MPESGIPTEFVCGYCGLPVLDTGGRWIHGDGVPATVPGVRGDYVTRLHRPGLPVRGYDCVVPE